LGAAGALLLGVGCAGTVPARANEPLREYRVEGDTIPAPLADQPGDPAIGQQIVANRQTSFCLLCHGAPLPNARFHGNLAPSLAGAGRRWSTGQLRLRIVDSGRLNPDTIMPSYYRVDGLRRVAAAFDGRPILSAQQIEHVVAYLATLKE
jgi:sulfur-oxidizing protein SoxX